MTYAQIVMAIGLCCMVCACKAKTSDTPDEQPAAEMTPQVEQAVAEPAVSPQPPAEPPSKMQQVQAWGNHLPDKLTPVLTDVAPVFDLMSWRGIKFDPKDMKKRCKSKWVKAGPSQDMLTSWVCPKMKENPVAADGTVELLLDSDDLVVGWVHKGEVDDIRNFVKKMEGCSVALDILITCKEYGAMNMGDALLVFYTQAPKVAFIDAIQEGNWNQGPDLSKPLNVGPIAYTILGVKSTKVIGESFTKVEASSGGAFAVVKYKLSNLTNETLRISPGNMELVDFKGRIFKPSSKARTALMMDARSTIEMELQPGLDAEFTTAFEVPEESITRPNTSTLVVSTLRDKAEMMVWFP